MKVSVIGLGYMGLPMAAILARAGHEVVGVDINPATVASVNRGECPFGEPGMPELIAEAHKSGRLRAVPVPEPAECFILSLPTPVDHQSHRPDMTFVEAGAASIAGLLQGGELVVLESTSPIGATQVNVIDIVEKMRPELKGKVDYVFCPERAIPGNTLHEMVHNDRLVGGMTPQAAKRGLELYRSFCRGELLKASTAEAEMVKLVENASRDAQIAFANELSLVCHQLGLDVWRVIALANHHPRVNILKPAPGVGGHCIAVDPWFIIHQAPEVTPLMRAVRAVNDGKPYFVADLIKQKVMEIQREEPGKTVKVACLGLAYKPNVDDLRESPSLTVVEALEGVKSIEVLLVEPHLKKWDKPLMGLAEAIEAADIVVPLTAHKAFEELPAGMLAGKWLLDSCGLYNGRPDVTRRIL